MDPSQKMIFVTQVLDSLSREYTKRVALAPDHWDGVELRWLLSDVAGECFCGYYGRSSRDDALLSQRYKNYENDRLTIAGL